MGVDRKTSHKELESSEFKVEKDKTSLEFPVM